jgi:hypothetical protein
MRAIGKEQVGRLVGLNTRFPLAAQLHRRTPLRPFPNQQLSGWLGTRRADPCDCDYAALNAAHVPAHALKPVAAAART